MNRLSAIKQEANFGQADACRRRHGATIGSRLTIRVFSLAGALTGRVELGAEELPLNPGKFPLSSLTR